MRIKNSMKNIWIGIASQVIIVLLGFISRKIFIDSLNISYLGIDGLLTNILSMLTLVEGGIGISIVAQLYKPLAEKKQSKIIALVQLYRKIYTVLALIILLISAALYPFLDSLMKGEGEVKDIGLIYLLFVTKNLISYLNAHKWSLINADQKGYVLAKVNLLVQVITTIVKIIVLVSTQNYILFLILELVIYLIQNLINGRIVDKRYSYIKTKEKYYIDSETKEKLKANVKALFLHNIGGYIVFGTDNLLISSFIGIATVGIYSNYTMIINQLGALVKPIISGVGASVGNLIATESSEKAYSVFKIMYLVNFWIYSFCVTMLYNLLQPFISWWLGEQYLLDQTTLTVILINFYLIGMRSTIATFKNTAGLFTQDKYAPLFEAAINLVASLILVKYIGLAGIFIGTTMSTVMVVFWTQPCIVYKHVFQMPVKTYFSTYSLYAVMTLTMCFITSSICNMFITKVTFLSLIGRGVICVFVLNIVYFVVFSRTEEFKYIKGILMPKVAKLRINSLAK